MRVVLCVACVACVVCVTESVKCVCVSISVCGACQFAFSVQILYVNCFAGAVGLTECRSRCV